MKGFYFMAAFACVFAMEPVSVHAQVIVSGFDQRYEASNFDTSTGTFVDSVSVSQNAIQDGGGALVATTTPNGSVAFANTLTNTVTDFDFTRDDLLSTTGFTIQSVIRLDDGNPDSRQGIFALDQSAGFGGVFTGTRTAADGNSVSRAGNAGDVSAGANILDASGTVDAALGVDGTWVVYTLSASSDGTDSTVDVSINLLSTGAEILSVSETLSGSAIVRNANTGRLFGGETGGAAGDTDEFIGAVADVVVYGNGALTDAELDQNFAFFQAAFLTEPTAIPEPGSGVLLGGMALLAYRRRRRN